MKTAIEMLENRRLMSGTTCVAELAGYSPSPSAIFVDSLASPAANVAAQPAATTGTAILTPTLVKTTVPTAVVSGSKIKGQLAYSITNTGTGLSKGPGSVTVFATASGVIDSTSAQVATLPKSFSLKAGKTTKATVQIKSVSLPTGTYTLIARIADPSGTTDAMTGPALTIAAPQVILHASLGSVSPATILVGRTTGKITVTINNTGNIDSTGPASVAIGLSTDGTSLTIPLNTVKKSSKIRANGKAVSFNVTFKIPKSSSAAGNYYALITYTQASTTLTAVTPSTFNVVNLG